MDIVVCEKIVNITCWRVLIILQNVEKYVKIYIYIDSGDFIMNDLELIKNKYTKLNYLEKLFTTFVLSFVVLFIFSMHCFVFTKKMFILLFSCTLFLSSTIVFITNLITYKKTQARNNKRVTLTFNIITILALLNSILQRLNLNIDFLFKVFENRIIDISLFLNISKINFLVDFVNANLILFILIAIIYSLIYINKISKEEILLIQIEKIKTFFNNFKENLNLKNENYGFLYKAIP